MSTHEIHLQGKCPLMPLFMGGQMSGRAFVRTSKMCPKEAEGIANSVDPNQTAPLQSDLGLHCLPRPICPKT